MTWFKLGAWGFVVGSIVTMIVGFSWGGWVTHGTADRIATERTASAVTAALVPVCLEKSKSDPGRVKKVEQLKALPSAYEQGDAVLRDGWATVGGSQLDRDVAEACASQLLKVAAK
jgi:dienelactone hydrolase